MNLKFAPTHEWALVSGNEASVGLSKHAVSLLGDVVYLELPKVGSQVVQKANIGFVESVKAASEIYSPMSGTVIAVNEDLIKNPGMLNQDSSEKAWLYRIALSNPDEFAVLLTSDAYNASLG